MSKEEEPTGDDTRARAWIFTWNNYTPEDVEFVKEWDCQYLIFGKEVGKKCGTPHLQGYVYFTNAKSRKTVRTKYGKLRSHWKVAKGTAEHNQVYCSKEHDTFEKGEPPATPKEKGKGERDRWQDAIDAVRDNRLEDVPADILVRNLRGVEYAIERIAASKRNLSRLPNSTRHLWVYGPPGTGKSRWASDTYPGAYDKDPETRWWNGYVDEDTVIIADFDFNGVHLGGDMKRWLDIFPFQAPIKYSQTKIRPKLVIVTSNYLPEQLWPRDPTLAAAIRRRCTFILRDEVWVEPEPAPEGQPSGSGEPGEVDDLHLAIDKAQGSEGSL